MELTRQQYEKIKDSLYLLQRGNVRLSNLEVLNANPVCGRDRADKCAWFTGPVRQLAHRRCDGSESLG